MRYGTRYRLCVIIEAVLMMTALAVVLADSSDATEYGVYLHANGDSEVTHHIYTKDHYIDTADLPAIPEGWEWWKCARPNIGSWVDLDSFRYDFSVRLTESDDVYAWDPADNGRPLPPVEPDHRDPPSDLSLAIPGAVVAGILLVLVFMASRNGEE